MGTRFSPSPRPSPRSTGEREVIPRSARQWQKYAWPQLIRGGLSGHEVLNLYAEAITRMTENQGIPPLFLGIFKNAFLPYRDPETLRLFLKEIDGFGLGAQRRPIDKDDLPQVLEEINEYLRRLRTSPSPRGYARRGEDSSLREATNFRYHVASGGGAIFPADSGVWRTCAARGERIL